MIKSEKQTFKIEIVAREPRDAVGARVSARRPPAGHRAPGRVSASSEKGKLLPEPVKGTPKVWEKQDGGLLDVEVHPQYAKNGWIYLSYSETLPGLHAAACRRRPRRSADRHDGRRRRARPQAARRSAVDDGHRARQDQQEQRVGRSAGALPRARRDLYNSTNAHYGSRFIFDKQGHLFFSLGDKQRDGARAGSVQADSARSIASTTTASVPKDNPFVKQAGALPTIWSYGHRNPQGLAWDPVTGKLWESEHGPQGGDEINIIEPGHNYGWGVITMGVQPGITKRSEPGMEQPIVYYTPTIAPSGIDVLHRRRSIRAGRTTCSSARSPGQQLRRLEISGDKVTHQEVAVQPVRPRPRRRHRT